MMNLYKWPRNTIFSDEYPYPCSSWSNQKYSNNFRSFHGQISVHVDDGDFSGTLQDAYSRRWTATSVPDRRYLQSCQYFKSSKFKSCYRWACQKLIHILCLQEMEVYEQVKRMLTQYLKSPYLSSRMACLYGLLYLLEGCKLHNITIGSVSEEMQLLLPCAVEYIQFNLNPANR